MTHSDPICHPNLQRQATGSHARILSCSAKLTVFHLEQGTLPRPSDLGFDFKYHHYNPLNNVFVLQQNRNMFKDSKLLANSLRQVLGLAKDLGLLRLAQRSRRSKRAVGHSLRQVIALFSQAS